MAMGSQDPDNKRNSSQECEKGVKTTWQRERVLARDSTRQQAPRLRLPWRRTWGKLRRCSFVGVESQASNFTVLVGAMS